jgi:hypothetical protein
MNALFGLAAAWVTLVYVGLRMHSGVRFGDCRVSYVLLHVCLGGGCAWEAAVLLSGLETVSIGDMFFIAGAAMHLWSQHQPGEHWVPREWCRVHHEAGHTELP